MLLVDCLVQGNPKEAEQIKSIAPDWVCQHHCWVNSDKLIERKSSNSTDEVWEKRKEEIYFGGQEPGEVTGSSLNNWPLCQQYSHLGFIEGVSGWVCAREQAGSLWSRVEVSGLCSVQDLGQWRGLVRYGLQGILMLSGLFWSGSWNVLAIAKCFRQCLNEVWSVIGNGIMGFS